MYKKNKGKLEDWVVRTFGATDIKEMVQPVGTVVRNIWKPGLYYNSEISNSLLIDELEIRNHKQAISILLSKLSDILLYIEPSNDSLEVYDHMLRELLILSCTEVENQLTSILKASNINPKRSRYNMNDYIANKDISNIASYEIRFVSYQNLKSVMPFSRWNTSNPSTSIKWYEAYNKTKHNRNDFFNEATLINVINSIAANLILACIRFGPYRLYNDKDFLSSRINEMVEMSIIENIHDKFYVPLIELPNGTRDDLFYYDSYREQHNVPWTTISIQDYYQHKNNQSK